MKTSNRTTLFKKGDNPNPNGRPKGSMNELKRKSLELRKRAFQDIEEAYQTFWEAFKAKESWAHQIYFKELVPFKREWLNEVSMINVPTEIKSLDDISSAIAALATALLNVDSIPTDEALNLIKTLNSVKLTEQFGKQNKPAETPEEYEARMQDIKLFIEWKKERNQFIDSTQNNRQVANTKF